MTMALVGLFHTARAFCALSSPMNSATWFHAREFEDGLKVGTAAMALTTSMPSNTRLMR
jgi:hypothetical protein